jgi:regulator of PEP synthase PpsR (kinase-PPPase family)
MWDLSVIFGDAAMIIGILGAVSLTVAYLRSDVTRKTVGQLKELADALDMRVKALEEEKEALVERIGHLEEENEILRSLLDGSRGAEDLRAQIDRNHLEVMTLFEKTIEKLEQLFTN